MKRVLIAAALAFMVQVSYANIFTTIWNKITGRTSTAAVGRGKKPKPAPCPPLEIVEKTLPQGVVGQPYFVQLHVIGGCPTL